MANFLKVLVKKRQELVDADAAFGGKTDAYVRMRILDADGETVAGPKETSVQNEGGANPEFNEEFLFEDLETPGSYTLKVTVLDKDSLLGIGALDVLAADDKLGSATLDLGTLSNTEDMVDKELIRSLPIHGKTSPVAISSQATDVAVLHRESLLVVYSLRLSAMANFLKVLVKSARNLKDADGALGGGTDAYVRMRILDADGNTVAGPKETTVKNECGANPEFNEEFIFEDLEAPGSYTLKVTVLDKDSLLSIGALDAFAADDKLGSATLDLGTLSNTEDMVDKELIIADGWFSDSTVNIAVRTCGGWGN
eukprot:CAMPEP_0183487900 /NCGR_PEP_ID=MMETSP0370-20130417/180672_1 /TAXON_ID=268820 /ORGANISM="Peridinium aciculiferum, Strain PAER-2" /LENGTH=310 /DNA_ID=CAMNT_0025681229 /DNA_START=52 /DNA_END=985 /DNA_ORIENTATION=+